MCCSLPGLLAHCQARGLGLKRFQPRAYWQQQGMQCPQGFCVGERGHAAITRPGWLGHGAVLTRCTLVCYEMRPVPIATRTSWNGFAECLWLGDAILTSCLLVFWLTQNPAP